MVEQEITNREEVRQCVFNNLQIINSLSDGKIPIDLTIPLIVLKITPQERYIRISRREMNCLKQVNFLGG